MAEFENFIELGDFMIEFKGHYLGYGRTLWQMTPEGSDIRRDAWSVPVSRQLKAVKWYIAVELAGGENFWQLIAPEAELGKLQFCAALFSDGAELKLFPADPRRAGFRFERVYLEKVEQLSGSLSASGTFKLTFSAEVLPENNRYFSRLAPGSHPADARLRKTVDPELLSQTLLDKLGSWLEVVPGQGISLNFMPQNREGAFALHLLGCNNWLRNGPGSFDYTLNAYFLLDNKAVIDRKLYQAAVALHGCSLEYGDSELFRCCVRELKSSAVKSSGSRPCGESELKFSLLHC